jgi:ketosteroid isomerase-like protein
MREQVIQVVEQYIDAVRHNDASDLPLHPDAVCEFPTNTYRGAASFRKGLDDFALIMKSIEVIRLVVDGEHCVAIVNIDTAFGVIPFAEHIHVANGQIVSIRGYCDPRPMLERRSSPESSPADVPREERKMVDSKSKEAT